VKVTQWFSAKTKPKRFGVYQTYDPYLQEEFYNLWDGKQWHCGWRSLVGRVTWRLEILPIESLERWRGLAEKPKGMK
jgi:hypothetical protein